MVRLKGGKLCALVSQQLGPAHPSNHLAQATVKNRKGLVAVQELLAQAGEVLFKRTNDPVFEAQINPSRGNFPDPVIGGIRQAGQAVLDLALQVGELLHRLVFVGVGQGFCLGNHHDGVDRPGLAFDCFNRDGLCVVNARGKVDEDGNIPVASLVQCQHAVTTLVVIDLPVVARLRDGDHGLILQLFHPVKVHRL